MNMLSEMPYLILEVLKENWPRFAFEAVTAGFVTWFASQNLMRHCRRYINDNLTRSRAHAYDTLRVMHQKHRDEVYHLTKALHDRLDLRDEEPEDTHAFADPDTFPSQIFTLRKEVGVLTSEYARCMKSQAETQDLARRSFIKSEDVTRDARDALHRAGMAMGRTEGIDIRLGKLEAAEAKRRKRKVSFEDQA